MDASVSDDIEQQVISIASSVDGVVAIEKSRIRKSGLGYLMDLHVEVDSAISVKDGHAIGHIVNDRLIKSSIPITDVVIHIEPAPDENH
jgi:divalent metal cation (Fe/Co/Zn/Cd) transporter